MIVLFYPWLMMTVMVRETRIQVGQGTVRYLEAGSGPPVVLLHGFPLSADMWRAQLENVPEGWRFIAPDLRGFGPEAMAPTHSMDDMAESVVAFLRAMRIDKVTLGGLSMGGYVAFAVMRRAPELAVRLILADTRATADNEQGRAARNKMVETLRTLGVSAVADEIMPKLLGETTRRHAPEVETRVRTLIAVNTAEGLAGAVSAMRDRPDSSSLLSSISVPTLVLVGEEDVLTPPADAEAMRSKLSRARLVGIPRAGHLSNLEAPEAFSTALADFLVAPL
jgi:3-oxoadipate enol-lactonase